MDKSILLSKSNQLFIIFFAIGLLLHTLSSLFIPFEYTTPIPFFAILYCSLLFFLQKKNINMYILQVLILIGLNGYILYINLDTPYYIHILLFVYPLFVASLYHSIVPSLILLPITMIEIIYLFQTSFHQFSETLEFGDLYIVLLFLSMLSLTAVFHSLFMQKTWTQLEKHKTSLEQALDSRDGYLHMFFENAKDSIAVFDLNSQIIEINPAFELMYGWSRQESIGNRIPLVPPENVEESHHRIEKVLRGESFYLFETKHMKKNGTFFDAQITLSPIHDMNKNMVAMSVITRDISYRKEAEKLIVQSAKLKLAGEIAAGVAHEIRNPMTVISGFIQMMNGDHQNPYKDYTKLIESELERINLIISEFLILAKPHVKTAKEFHLQSILQDIVLLFSPEFNLRSIILKESWHIPDVIIEGEQNQLKQVFINIIKNAIESFKSDGILHISTDFEEEDFVGIHIEDNGEGMTQEVVSQIFEPFFTTKSAGTGLGMMISQKIIQEHGGKIVINSQINKGTIVSIYLPYKTCKNEQLH